MGREGWACESAAGQRLRLASASDLGPRRGDQRLVAVVGGRQRAEAAACQGQGVVVDPEQVRTVQDQEAAVGVAASVAAAAASEAADQELVRRGQAGLAVADAVRHQA